MHDTAGAHAAHQHAAPTGFIRKHIFSLDHKVIGKQYYGLALLAVFIGMVLSWLMRIHLGWPAWPIPLLDKLSAVGAPQGVMTPEYYLSLMTMHGTIMVFFVLTNAPFAAFGNYFLPIQIGAEDMAFPRFNMMSFWVTFTAFLVMRGAFSSATPRRFPAGPPTHLSARWPGTPGRDSPWVKRFGRSRSRSFASPPCSAPSISSPPRWTCAPRECRWRACL